MSRQTITLFLAATVLFGAAAAAQESIVDREDQSTVRVLAESEHGLGSGTGFIVGDGQYIVTNHHVIASAHDTSQLLVLARGLKRHVVKIELDSPEKDIVVLRLDQNTERPPVSFGLRSAVKKQQSVIAAGFPGAGDKDEATSDNLLEVKFTKGIISAYVQERTGEALYQISAPINPGNSGGPLFDECGRVIGVNYEKSLANTIQMGANGPTVARMPLGEGIAWSIQADEVVNLLHAANIPVTAESTACGAGGTTTAPIAAAVGTPSSSATSAVSVLLFLAVAGFIVLGLVVVLIVYLVKRSSRKAQPAAGPTRLYTTPPHERAIRGLSGQFAGVTFPLTHGPLRIGRDPAENNIVIQDAKISRRHCTVSLGPGPNEVVVTDCGSAHGTFLGNGEKLANGASRSVYPQGRFYLVDSENLFEVA